MNKPYGEAFGQIGGEEEDPFLPLGEQADPFLPDAGMVEQEPDQSIDDSAEDPFAPEDQDPFEPVATEEAQDEEPDLVSSDDPFAPQEEVPYDATLPEPEPAQPVASQAPEPVYGEAEMSANSLMNYATSAAEQIGKLFGTTKEATTSVLIKRMEAENDKMLSEGWDRSQDFKLFDAELRKRTQGHVGELLTEGTKVEQMGGPDALLQGRENMEKRKAAKGKAVDDFGVNLVSRSLGSGFLQTGAGLLDAGATVASIAGMDNIEKYLTDKGKALLDVQGYIPFEVNGVEDVSNILDAGALVTKATGEMAPQIALSYLAGGALLAGARAAPVTSQLATRSPTAIRMAGGFVANTALETGGIAREQLETNGKISPGFAIGGGLAAASLETYADAKLFKNLWKMLKVPDRELLLKDLATKSAAQIIKTIGVNSIKQAGAESVTETAQEGINYLSADLAKNDPDFIKNISSGEFDPNYWGAVTERLVDAGVQGAAGGLGMSTLFGLGEGATAYYTNKARRIYGEMKTAEKEDKDNLEILRQAADAAEKSGSPLTAEAMREERAKQAEDFLSRKFDDQGLPEIMAMDEQEAEEGATQEKPEIKPREEFQKPQEQAQEKQVPAQTAPMEDDLSNYEPTGDTFESEEAAVKYLDTLPDAKNYQIVDNSDVDSTTGEIIPDYMLIKRKAPISQNEEQSPTQVAEAMSEAKQPTQETAQAVQQPEAANTEQTVQPTIVEQSPEAVTPALEPKAEEAPVEQEKPVAQLSDDQKTLTRLPERDFVNAIQTLIGQNSPESRAAAHDMLLERYIKASTEGKGYTETSKQLLESLTANMAENNENPDKVERWQVQRSTDALMDGLFSESGLGTGGKRGKGWNAYAPNVKGVPDYETKVDQQVMLQVQSILNDIKKGSRGRTKVEAVDGRKTPPVISDSMDQWVEYGKNLASNIAKNAVLRVGEANKNSKLTSFEALENTQISEDDASKYTDEGEEVELENADAPTWEKEANVKEEQDKSGVYKRTISLVKDGVDMVRNSSDSPLHKAVVDYHLGKLGMPNESGFDGQSTYADVGESVRNEVKQPDGKLYSYQTIGRMARDMGPEIEKQILDVIQKQNANANEETYRSIIRPEAVKKENRAAKNAAKGIRQLKSSVFDKIYGLKNKDLISNFEKTQLLDLVPNELTEGLADQLNAELDNAAEQEDLDTEMLIQNINERIQNYVAPQELTDNEGSSAGNDQRSEIYVQGEDERAPQRATEQPSSLDGQRGTNEPAISGDTQNVQGESTEPGSGNETEDVDGGVSPDQSAVDEAAGKAWKAILDRANKAAELGIIDNNALEIIQSGLTSIISSPNSDFDSTLGALSEFLDTAENQALQDELSGEGIATALAEGGSRGSERPQRSESGVQGRSDKDSSKENRQGVRNDTSKQKAVSGGDKESGRAQEAKAGDSQRGQTPAKQIDNGPRPGLTTSFEKLIPAPKKEYVKFGDFGLDENQAKAVNLMVQSYEEGKKAFILGDGTGMGKTLTYMVAGQLIAELKGAPVLLVALNRLWLQQRFEADLKRFGLKRAAFFVKTYDEIREDPSLSTEFFPAVIFDEAHTLKNDSTKTSQMAAKLQTGFKVFATATPLDEVKQAAYFLSELTGESEDQVLTSLGFQVSYDSDPNVPGGLRRRLTSREDRRDTDRALGELAAQAVRNGQYVRRYYPFWGKIYKVEVKMTEDQSKDYQKQIRYWERQEGMSSNPGLVRGQKTQGLKRWTETIKGKYILENSLKWLEENPTGKIVVMTDTAANQKIKGLRGSKAEVQGVAGFLNDAFNAKGFKTVRIFGTKNEKDTYGPLKQFQSQDPSVRIAVSTIASGGTGIDLDDQYGDQPRLVWFAGTNFAASKVEQAMGRTSRRNTKSPSELRIVIAPESYGDTRAEEIKNQKMLNLRAIQGQAIEEQETSEGGKLTSENTSFVPMTKYYEDAEVLPFEGAKVDTRLEEYEPEVQNTVKEFSKIAGKGFPGTKIVFGEYGTGTAWADPAALAFDTIFINPDLLHKQFKDSLASNTEVAKTAMEFVVDEEMSHNNYFKSVYAEAEALGVEPTEYLNEELNKIASGLTEGIKEKVRSRYEVMGGGKIQSNHHLVMEYMRMLDQFLRKGSTTELKLTLQAGTPNVFGELLPRSSVPMEGQNALYRLFDSLINFFKGLLNREGLSPQAAKAVKERLEKLDKMFKETSNPVLGTFGNRPSFNAKSQNISVPASNLKVSSKEIANSETLLKMHQKFKMPSDNVTGRAAEWLDKIIAYSASQTYDFYDPVKKKEEELVRGIRERFPEDSEKLAPKDFFGMDLLPAERSPYKLMRLSADSWQTTEYALHHGIPIWKDGSIAIKPGSKGLIETLGQLGNAEDADLFRLYMVAKRAEELQAQGKDAGFTQKEIEEGLALGSRSSSKSAEFSKIFSEYREFQDGVLQFAVDSGLVSPALKKLLNELHKNYVPFYRTVEVKDLNPDSIKEKLSGPFSRKQVAGQRSGIKRFTGGEEPIGDLYENMVKNISHLIQASVRNTAMLRLERVNGDLDMLTGQNFWAPVSPGMVVSASVKDFTKYLRSVEGINISDSDIDSGALARVFGIGGRKDQNSRATGIISFMRRGKPAYRKIEEGNRSLLEALTISESVGHKILSNGFVKMFANVKTLFQRGVTLPLDFTATNAFRDMVSSFLTNKVVTPPLLNTIRGAVALYTKKDELSKIRGQGAGNPSSFSSARKAKSIYDELPQLKEKTLIEKTFDTAQQAIGMLDKIGETAESIHRTAVTMEAMNRRNVSPAEAAWIYKQSNTDFSAHGANAAIRLLSATVPFFNAGLQSMYRLWGSYADGAKITNDMTPTRQMLEKLKPRTNQLMYRGAVLALLALIYAALQSDDERYDDLPDYEKDNYFIFFIGGTKVRIRKPFEVGTIFFTLPEMMATAVIKREMPSLERLTFNALSVFRGAVPSGSLMAVPGLPQALRPMSEIAANKDFFTGNPIIPRNLQDTAPSMQYKENTPSILAEGLARVPGVKDSPGVGSPLVQQKLIEGYFGTMGKYFLFIASAAFDAIRGGGKGGGVEKDWQEGMFIRSFFAKAGDKETYDAPTYPTKYGKEFYEIAKEITVAENTMRGAKKLTNEARQDEYDSKYEAKSELAKEFRAYSEEINNIEDDIRAIRSDDSGRTPTERKEEINQLLRDRNLLFKEAVKTYKEWKSEAK